VRKETPNDEGEAGRTRNEAHLRLPPAPGHRHRQPFRSPPLFSFSPASYAIIHASQVLQSPPTAPLVAAGPPWPREVAAAALLEQTEAVVVAAGVQAGRVHAEAWPGGPRG